jgi:hypothetical protein
MQTDMDVVRLLEVACIAIILLIQLYQYGQNKRKINNLKNIYPDEGLVIVDIEEVEGLKLINPNNDFNSDFLHILSSTNLYLQKNRVLLQTLIYSKISRNVNRKPWRMI